MQNSNENELYEIAYLLRFEEDGAEVIKVLNQFKAEIVKESELTHTKLAYPVKKEKAAYFGYIHFNLQPDQIEKLSAALELNAKVLRFLIISSPSTRREEVRTSQYSAREVVEGSQEKAPRDSQPAITSTNQVLSNEALEEKLEEILK